MATPGAEFVTFDGKAQLTSNDNTDAELRELEKEIANCRAWSTPSLLKHVLERVSSITLAHGAAIAVSDQWGVICRASVGEAPEIGSRLRPDSALTRECFDTGQVVVCEDTENDYRVRRSTANNLGLRSAVVVPLQNQGSVLGVIEILSSRPSAFSTTHIVGLQRIAQLLASILATAPIDAEIETDVLVTPPQSEGLAEVTVEPAPTVAPPKELKSTKLFLVAGAAILLLLFLVWLAVPRLRQMTRSSARIQPPVPLQSHPVQPPSIRPESTKVEAPGSDSQLDFPAASSSSPVSPPLNQSTEQVSPAPEKPPLIKGDAMEDATARVIRPAVPAIVIQGTPPGTQIFLDDHWVAATNPAGQAGVSTLAAGQHHLRLSVNGYRDYDQEVDVQTGKTFTINAKLDPLELPTLSEPVKSPVLSVTTAIPAPVILTRPLPPDFVLNRTFKGHNGWVTAVAFSPDGRRLVSGSWDRTLKFWEVSTGELLDAVAKNDMKEVQALAFSRDGHWLATENSSDTTSLRNPSTGQEIRTLSSDKPLGPLGSNWVYSIAFSPDGRWLASALDDKTVRLWDVNTGRKVRDLTGLRRAVVYIAFSPNGRLLATGDDPKNVRIWDPASGEEIYKLTGHKKPIYAVAFSPDSRWLASASADKTVKIWDLAVGHELHTLAGHGNLVTSLAFSPDGRWLVSGSWDKTVKIWDVESGRELQTLSGHDHPVYSVAFDSRGQWLASGGEDGTIKLWRLRSMIERSGSLR
jgi:WD40 repeat protein